MTIMYSSTMIKSNTLISPKLKSRRLQIQSAIRELKNNTKTEV